MFLPFRCKARNPKPVLEKLFGSEVGALSYYFFMETEVDGIPVVVTRTGWSGEVGYEIYLRDGSRGADLWERVMEAGKPYGIVPTGPSDIRRVEAGILNHGIDITLDTNPYEADLGWLVNLKQPADFIGKDRSSADSTRGSPTEVGGNRNLGRANRIQYDALGV